MSQQAEMAAAHHAEDVHVVSPSFIGTQHGNSAPRWDAVHPN